MGDKSGRLKRSLHKMLLGYSLPQFPLIEISGTQRVLIENHMGITQYVSDQICIRVSFGTIIIKGRDLLFSCITGEKLLVYGSITAVSLEEEPLEEI